MQEAVRNIIAELGEDPDREGLLKTPERVEKSLHYLTRGYQQNLEDVIHGAIFTSEQDDMIIVRDIEFYSMCEHHLLPFFGKCHIGYIPKGKIFGVSKLARLVDMFARRLQIQERLCQQVAQAIFDTIKPEGVGVVMEAPSLHADARSAETEFRHGDLDHAGLFPQGTGDPAGIPEPDPEQQVIR